MQRFCVFIYFFLYFLYLFLAKYFNYFVVSHFLTVPSAKRNCRKYYVLLNIFVS